MKRRVLSSWALFLLCRERESVRKGFGDAGDVVSDVPSDRDILESNIHMLAEALPSGH